MYGYVEAMRSRHTVRAYTNKPIPDDIVSLLTRRVAHDNQNMARPSLYEPKTQLRSAHLQLIRAKGVRNFLIMSANLREGEDPRELDGTTGICGRRSHVVRANLGS